MSCTSMPKCSRSELAVGEADQRGNTEGEGSPALLSVAEADQRDNVGREEVAVENGSEEEADQRDNAGGGEVALKKGPWTKEEDEILVDYIKKHGERNWNAVQKNSGLARCGKSCRLRWLNHLRPELKTGRFTAEEEHKIIELHFLKGSKWAQMAALLPGRTDNDIKNFWHSRYKKRKRAGLPIYPSEISSKSFSGSQESADISAIESSQHNETENFNMDITDLDLTHFKFCQDMLPTYFDSQYSKPISDSVGRCSDSFHNTLPIPRAVEQPRYLFSSSSATVPEVFDQYVKYPMLSTPSDPILNTNLLPGYDNQITGFHTASNISSSEPVYGSTRVELPSFQNSHTQQRSWNGTYVSQFPSFEFVDTPVEPCPSVPAPLDCSHLIDPIVYYNTDQNLKGSSIDSLQGNISSSEPIYGSMRVDELPSFQNSHTQQRSWNGTYVSQLPSFEFVDTSVEPYPSVPAPPDCSHLIDPIVYYNTDQNLKGSSIDSLQGNISSSEPVHGSMRVDELPSFQNSYTQQRSWNGTYVSQLPSFESVDMPVQAPPIEPCPSVPAPPDYSHLIDPIVYYNSDQNLKGSSIDQNTDISTQWNRAAVVTRQLDFLRSVRQRRNFLRWVRSEIETPLNYDINHGAFNDQLPAYDTSIKRR